MPPPSFPSSSMTILSNNRQMNKYHHHYPRRISNSNRFCRSRVVLGVVGIVSTVATIWSIRTSITILVPAATTDPNNNNSHNKNIPGFRHYNHYHDGNRQRKRTRAVFYNIYVPPPLPPVQSTARNGTSSITTATTGTTTTDEDDGAVASVDNVLEIIKEQLLFIRSSELLKSSTIYYTLIGAKNFLKTHVETRDPNKSASSNQTTPPVVTVVSSSVDDEIQGICHDNGLNCIQSRYISKGSETVTLQSMWEYCTNETTTSSRSSSRSSIINNSSKDREDDDRLVTYIHSKGSFHPSTLNDNFRIMAMTAVMSDECQSIPIQPQQQQIQHQRSCNVCTGRFVPFPHFHPTGNFFVATCDYIKRLIPPKEFEQRMEDMMQFVLFGDQQQQHQQHQTQSNHSQASSTPIIPKPTFQQYHNGWTVGTERFANEHWVSSYLPTFDPCDVVPLQRYRVGYKNLPKAIKPFAEKHKYEEGEGQGTHQPPKRNEKLWTPSLASAPRFDLKTFMKRTTDRGSWFCGQARLFEYTYLYRQYYRSTTITSGSSSNSTSISNNNNIIIDPPPVGAKSFIWDYYHEAFKGCPEPLNYTKHGRLFMEQ